MRSINRLKAEVGAAGGIARPNKFLVELPELSGASPDKLNLLCRSATLPGKQIITHERRIGMKFEKVAYGYAVEDVTLSFLLLNDYSAREYFDTWREKTIDEEGLTAKYKRGEDGYAKDITIHQLKVSQEGQVGGGLLNLLPTVASAVGGRKAGALVGFGFNLIPDPELAFEPVYSVKLIDAFPTTITAVEFTSDEGQFLECSVSLAYTNWEVTEATFQKHKG